MKTPIYLDYEATYPQYLASNELNIYDTDPIDIYTDPLDTVIQTTPYLLSPRYYILIHRPSNQPGPSIRIDLHKSPISLLRNKIRVSLEPSIGWGVNGSYKVEYWEWIPNINLAAIPSKKRVRSEYWYIPTIDPRTYVPHFPFDIRLNEWYPRTTIEFLYKPLLTSTQVPVDRTVNIDTVSDVIIDEVYSNIFCFPKETFNSFTQTITTETLNFNAETLTWNFSKRLDNSTLVRNLSEVDGDLVTGTTTTTITYLKPLHPKQVIFIDYDDILNDGLSYTPYYI